MFFDFERDTALEILTLSDISIGDPSCWWVRKAVRAVTEIHKMEEKSHSIHIQEGKKLIWYETITTNFENDYFVSIEAKDYPFKMPKAFLLSPHIEPSHKKHMYTNDGSICYMHPDEYHPDISILDVRNMVSSWCFALDAKLLTGEWGGPEYEH